MDIKDSLEPVISSLIDNLKVSIESELRDKVSEEIVKKIANTEVNTIIEQLIEQQITKKIDKFDFVNASQEQLTKIVARLTDQINTTLASAANTQINSYLTQKLAQVNLTDLVSGLLGNKLSTMLDARNFPPQSIPQTAIDFNGLVLRGEHIKGGIIEQFGSVGIEDRATGVQMTLMDHATAFEGPLWAPELKVKGDITLDGNLVINGDIDENTPAFDKLVVKASRVVKQSLNADLFSGFSDVIFKKIQTDGIDLDQIKQNGREIIKDNQLGYHVTDSNLQRVGMLRDLQTRGENLLSDTLYVTPRRVGINTMDPNAVLSVWDEEVEINFSKRGQDIGSIGTPRHQSLVLSANGKNNLILNPDGTVEVDSITIGTVIMTSATTIPNHSGITGQIVWNQNPAPGAAIGWVCLGGHLWAKFGTIE
jgi:hypothetical protein